MTKLRFLLLVAIILQLPFYSVGQFSREQAKDLVLNQILAHDTGHFNVYSSYDTKSDPNGLVLMNNRQISLPYASNWVFLSDDDPFAYWCHPCRYVIVNSNNGDYTVDSADIYPVDFKTGYEIILQIQGPTQLTPPCSNITPTTSITNTHLHAVLIAGGDDSTFVGNLALMYNTLIEAGYPTTNITVLYYKGWYQGIRWNGDLDHNGIIDITNAAYRGLIDTTFKKLSGLIGDEPLNNEDQLFVYVTGDGNFVPSLPDSVSSICIPLRGSPTFDEYTSTNLVAAVHSIPCAQMIFVMQQCHSGGFIDPLRNDQNPACKNRLIQTACGKYEIAHIEYWITSGKSYGEFTYYWSAAARGYYPGTRPWKWSCRVGDFPFSTWEPDYPNNWKGQGHPPDYNPDNGDPILLYGNGVDTGNSDGYTQFIEAFNYANCMNTYTTNGYYNTYQTTALPENPDQDINNGFGSNDLFCLNGIAGNTSTSFVTQTVDSRNYLLGGQLNVLSPMDISDYATFTMGVDNSIIKVYQNKQFNIGSNVTFKPN
jgi:hypothetical protein